MSEQVKKYSFGKQFLGYKVEDVNAYILSLSDEYKKSKEEMQNVISELKAENAELKEEIEKKNEEEPEGGFIIVEKSSYDKLSEKAEKYDSLNTQVGESIFSVTSKSHAVIEDSKNEAVSTIRSSMNSVISDSEKAKKELTSGTVEFTNGLRMSINELTEKYIDEYIASIKSIIKNASLEEEKINENKNNLERQIKTKAEIIKKEFEEKIDELRKSQK